MTHKMITRLFMTMSMISLLAASLASAQTLPSTAGWYSIPNTKIRSVCPSGTSLGDCANVTAAWNSAVFDTTRNRLIIWGGGHSDYFGNEIYALNLNANPITMTRLNNPSTQQPTTCSHSGTTGDNQPVSRHTYDHIVYMSHVDRMFVFGGAGVPCGFMLGDTWTFSFTSMTWQKMNPSGPIPEANYGRVTVYNPATQKVYIHDQTTLYSYSYENNRYTALANYTIGQEMQGVFDSKRQLFVLIGNGAVYAYDVSANSSHQRQTWNTSGGSTIVNANNPGVAYDPVTDRIVGWDGGNTVYSLDPTTKVWTPISFAGGPGPAISNGTFKRWSYSQASGVFVVVNSVDSNAFALRLAAGSTSSPTAETTPPSVPSNVSGTAVSSSQINLFWTPSTDNVGVTGYRIFRNGNQVGTSATATYTDTGLSASTTYVYTVSAADAAGNISSPSTGTGITTQPAGGSGSDFSSRCSAAGVVLCEGFDNTTTDIVRNVNLWPGDGGYWGGSLDTSTYSSGGGSLKFTLPAGRATSDISGSWNGSMGASFGENSTFYIQFQQRLSPEMISNLPTWRSGTATSWKTVLFHRTGSTCGQIEITTVPFIWSNIPAATMYTGCGERGFYTDGAGTLNGGGPYIQQGASSTSGYKCDYNNIVAGTGNGTGCFIYQSNKWLTFYYKIHIGTYGSNNSSVEAWVAMDGGAYKQFVNVKNIPLYKDGPSPADKYNEITFTPYMTNLNNPASSTAYVWYDELIVSTQPIAAPGGGGGSSNPPPAAPMNLRVQ
jgi:hypothetical protein